MPTLWQKSLPDPIGTAANSGRRSAGTLINPLTISCPVPPPPNAATTSYPSRAAWRAISAAWPGDSVEAHSNSPFPAMIALGGGAMAPVRVRVEDELDPLHGSASRESASPREPEEAV